MTTGHEHTFGSLLNIVTANSAAWRLKLEALLLAVLLFDFNDRQAIHCFLFSALAPCLPLGFLLAHSSDHLE